MNIREFYEAALRRRQMERVTGLANCFGALRLTIKDLAQALGHFR